MKLTIEISEEQMDELASVAEEWNVSVQTACLRLIVVGCRLFPGMASDVGFDLGMDLHVNSEGSVGLEPKLRADEELVIDYSSAWTLAVDGCDYKLSLTCGMCPEQYDVTYEETPAGYLRLRHGNFTAIYPDVGGQLVFEAATRGDGAFEDNERRHFLTTAVERLHIARKESS